MPLDSVWNGTCDPEFFRQNHLSFPPCPNGDQLATLPDDWKQACLEEAEHYLKHEYTFFAFENHPYGDVIDWNRDYSGGKAVAQGYAPDIDHRNPEKVGDVKYVWELARLQHLVRLAQAWRYSRDERYAKEITAQITDFILRVPYMQSIHWTSGIEVGLRLISMTWAFHLICDYSGLTADFCSLLIRSVDQHLTFIDHHYSAYSFLMIMIVQAVASIFDFGLYVVAEAMFFAVCCGILSATIPPLHRDDDPSSSQVSFRFRLAHKSGMFLTGCLFLVLLGMGRKEIRNIHRIDIALDRMNAIQDFHTVPWEELTDAVAQLETALESRPDDAVASKI